MNLKKLLFHPHITLASTIAAIAAAGAAATAFVAALDPVLKLPFLASYLPIIQRIDGDLVAFGLICTALVGILNAVSGAGRSFVSSVDNGPQS